MAIRDRVRVYTRDGRAEEMVVESQGGSIIVPDVPRQGVFKVEMQNKNLDPTGEFIAVPVDNISSVVVDRAPKEARKTKG